MKPIRKSSLADAVSDRVLTMIRDGDLKPGDRLPTERELVEQFGVGRTSVREGLHYLQKIGVLDIRQGRGMIVRSPSLSQVFASSAPLSPMVDLPERQIRDTMHARLTIELESSSLAAVNRSDRDLAAIEALVEGMKANMKEPRTWFDLDRRFHVAVAAASGNEVFVELVKLLWDLIVEHRESFLKNPLLITNSTPLHEGVFLAIKDSSPDRARAVMLEHLKDTRSIVLLNFPDTDVENTPPEN